MLREEFIKRVMKKYPSFFNEVEKAKVWKEDFEIMLPEKTNLEELYRAVLYQHMSIHPPVPAWIKQKWDEIVARKREEERMRFKAEKIEAFDPKKCKEWLELGEKIKKRSQELTGE